MKPNKRLMEPVYYKNIRIRAISNENNSRIQTEKKSLNQSVDEFNYVKPVVPLIRDYLRNQEFAQRNFARLCDSTLLDTTTFHQKQKFGVRRIIRLDPIQRNIKDKDNRYIKVGGSQSNIAGKVPLHDYERKAMYDELLRKATQQDDRRMHRQIIHSKNHNMAFIFMLKSFTISEQTTSNETDIDTLPTSKRQELHLNFSDMEAILQHQKLEDILHFFQNNLEVIEKGRIKIDFKAITEIAKDKTVRIDLPKKLIIENRHGSGYFLVQFPIVIIYQPEFNYHQKVTVSTQQIFELLKTDFKNCDQFLKYFDKDKFIQHCEIQRQIRQQKGKLDITPDALYRQAETTQPLSNQPEKVQDLFKANNAEDKKLEDETQQEFQLIVTDYNPPQEDNQEDVNLDQSNWGGKVIKKVVEFEGFKYIVTFCPSKIVVREKISEKVVKVAFPSFEEFNILIEFSKKHHLKKFLEQHVRCSVPGMDEMEFKYEAFKKYLQIKIDWPSKGEPDATLQIGEEQLENGILDNHEVGTVLNNKHFIVKLCPPTCEIYNQTKQLVHRRQVTSDLINDMICRKYLCDFQLI